MLVDRTPGRKGNRKRKNNFRKGRQKIFRATKRARYEFVRKLFL